MNLTRRSTGKTPSCPTVPSVGQLQARIKELAKAMKTCEAAVAKAETKEKEVAALLDNAQTARVAAHARLIGKAFTLGGELVALEKEMEATKGKHRGDTFRKAAIQLLGNKNAVYRPMAIYRYLTKYYHVASEVAAIDYCDGQSYRALAEEAQSALQHDEENERRANALAAGETPTPSRANKKAPTAPKSNRQAKRKPATPLKLTETDPDAGPEKADQIEPLTHADLKAETELWLSCFSPDPDADEVTSEAIPAAILFAIDTFCPNGLEAAIAWLQGVQRERNATCDPAFDDLHTTVVYSQEDGTK